MSSKWDWLEDELSEDHAKMVHAELTRNFGFEERMTEIQNRIEQYFDKEYGGSLNAEAEMGALEYIANRAICDNTDW